MRKMKWMVWVLSALFISCAPKQIWLSNPEKAEVSTPRVVATLKPLKGEGEFYSSFRLMVRNLTDLPMKIDWNRTQYLHDDLNRGRFAFYGINPEDIRDNSIPPDVIPPGQSFSKEIGPVRFVAFSPYRDGFPAAGESRISFGILPEGDNGILLILDSGRGELKEKMSVKISSEILSH